MKKYTKEFMLRGLIFAGLGPIVLGIVYYVISIFITDLTFAGGEVLLGIISTYILAFVHAGASVFNQIEEWPIMKSLLFHFSTLYVAYSFFYLVNSWIPFDPVVFLIFTAIFVVGYLTIWGIVYLLVKNTGRKFNERLSG